MSKCKNCNVEILDDSQICPLCHSVLEEGEEGRNTYPDAWIPTRRFKICDKYYILSGVIRAVWQQAISIISGIRENSGA